MKINLLQSSEVKRSYLRFFYVSEPDFMWTSFQMKILFRISLIIDFRK